MHELHRRIRAAIRRDKVVFSVHADNRLQQRRIVRWQVVEGFEAGELLQAYISNKPNPKILLRQTLADGSQAVAVWAFVESIACAKLVTVYFEENR